MKKSFTYAPMPFLKMPKGFKKLAVSNAIYITHRDKSGKKIPKREMNKRLKETENFFLKMFGGYTTVVPGKGEFLSKKTGETFIDNIFKIVSFSDVKRFKEHRNELKKWISEKKRIWNQESMAFEFEGDLFYL